MLAMTDWQNNIQRGRILNTYPILNVLGGSCLLALVCEHRVRYRVRCTAKLKFEPFRPSATMHVTHTCDMLCYLPAKSILPWQSNTSAAE